jgi:hypothetical protein
MTAPFFSPCIDGTLWGCRCKCFFSTLYVGCHIRRPSAVSLYEQKDWGVFIACSLGASSRAIPLSRTSRAVPLSRRLDLRTPVTRRVMLAVADISGRVTGTGQGPDEVYRRTDNSRPVSFTVSAWEWVYSTNLSRLQRERERETCKLHVGEAHNVLITAILLPQRLSYYWDKREPLRMLTNLRLPDLLLTTAQQRSTGQNLPSDI